MLRFHNKHCKFAVSLLLQARNYFQLLTLDHSIRRGHYTKCGWLSIRMTVTGIQRPCLIFSIVAWSFCDVLRPIYANPPRQDSLTAVDSTCEIRYCAWWNSDCLWVAMWKKSTCQKEKAPNYVYNIKFSYLMQGRGDWDKVKLKYSCCCFVLRILFPFSYNELLSSRNAFLVASDLYIMFSVMSNT